MMSSEDDTDCCYGLQYGGDSTTTTIGNSFQVKNQNQSKITTTSNSISGCNHHPVNCNCTSSATNTTTTTANTPAAPGSPSTTNTSNGGGGGGNGGSSPPAHSAGCVGNSNHHNSRRARQRVDAGEPRNSYSSIPNFTSRPTFMSGGLYGAIFSQTAQQHFSLFSGTGISGHPAPSLAAAQQNALSSSNTNSAANNFNLNPPNCNTATYASSNNNGNQNCNGVNGGNYANNRDNGSSASASGFVSGAGGPVKMLNELLGRQVKQAQDATGPDSCNGNANLIQSSTTTAASLDNYLTEQQQQQFTSDPSAVVPNKSAVRNVNPNNNNTSNITNNSSVDLLGQDTQDSQLNATSANLIANEQPQQQSQGQHDHMLISSTSTPTNSQSPPALPQNANELAQHMLRNILQQSKKDLLAFDQEMQRVVANQQRQLGLDSAAVVNSSELCAMISDSAKQLTKQMVKLEMDAEEAVHQNGGGDLMICTGDSNNENINNNNCKTIKKTTSGGKCLENGLEETQMNKNNGMLAKQQQQQSADNNNNENNANMNVQSTSCSDNEENSMHSVKSSKDEDIELMLDQANNHNSMDGLEKRRRSSCSPVISSSSSSSHKSNGEQPVAMDMKRARVENIVSTMRSSPILPTGGASAFSSNNTPVNGCKKRKLYQPQQHDTAADRYAAAAAAGLNLGLNLQNLLMANSHLQQTFLAANAHLNEMTDEDLDDDQHGRNGDVDMSDVDDLGSAVESTATVHQKREEKNALKSQLQSMQEQLAEMQQKYVQLCTRMEQESDAANTIAEDVDDNSDAELLNETNADDIEDLDDDDEPEVETNEMLEEGGASTPAVITTTTTPLLSTTTTMSSNRMMRQLPADSNNNNLNKTPSNGGVRTNQTATMNQVMNKLGNKMGGGPMHPAAAVAAALHSQLPLGGPFGGQGGNSALFHHLQQQQQQGGQAAAAAAAAHELLQQQHQQQSNSAQQHALSNALSNAWASQKLFLEQEARNLMSKDEDQREMLSVRDREPRTPQNNQSNAQRENNPHHNLKPPGQKIQERLSMMRPTSSIASQMIGPIMSGNELEGLADMLKSEITASLSHLVDTIVTRFLHQKRFMGKQSEAAAAAAEQLSKDLMMATQLLDRKSPRTKVADRPTGPNQSAAMFQTPKTPTSSQTAMQQSHSSKVAALNQVAAAALYNSMNQFCMPPPQGSGQSVNGGNSHMDSHSEQTEALPLVVQPKKKRHKVTDTRITPRTVSRILAQDGILPSQMSNGSAGLLSQSPLSSLYAKHEEINNNQNGGGSAGQRDGGSSQNVRDNNRDNQSGVHQMTSPVSSTAPTMTSPQPGTMSGSHSGNNQGSGNNGQGGQHQQQQKQQHQQQQMNAGQNNGSSGNGGNNSGNNGSANSPMNSPQSRQSHLGGNPNAPLHLAQGFHPSMPSLPPNQQSMMPVSLPTSVAIPNPSLPEESEVFSPYSPLFGRHGHGADGASGLLNGGAGLPYGLQPQFGHHHHHHIKMSSSPPGMGGGMMKNRDSPPLSMHHSTMLHPALLAAAHHGNSPDYASHMRHQSMDSNNNTNDRSSDCNDLYDGIQPTISFFKNHPHLRLVAAANDKYDNPVVS